MTKEEIIEMAIQAGYVGVENGHPALETFAKLIAEKEREEFWNRIESKGDWTEYEKQMIEKAILKEREECAKIIDDSYTTTKAGEGISEDWLLTLSELIRARGQE